MKIVLTNHARFEIERRNIDPELVNKVACKPMQKVKLNYRLICKSTYFDKSLGKEMLIRIIIERTEIITIITAYKTSRIERYWI